MVQNNKILTVSYGTFSCTLEGFDDSFGTMKAIAEYFRDLAADDRYFGAEPPQPDAEMLARIAEREIARRVEARLDSGGIVLRAGTNAIVQTPAEADEPAVAATEPETDVAEAETVAQQDVAVADTPETAEPVEAPQDVEPEGAETSEAAIVAQDAHVEDLPVEEPDIVEAEPVAATVTPSADPDSIAAKLARIRAVVAKQEAPRADYIEDQHAENFLTTEAKDISALIGEEFDNEPAPEIENTAAKEADEISEETADASEPETVDPAITAPETVDETPAIAEQNDDGEEDELASVLSKLDAHEARQDLFSEDDDEEEDDEDDDLRNILAEEAKEDARKIHAPAPTASPRAHVIKVSREDFDRAISRAKAKAPEAEPHDTQVDFDPLEPDAEDDLQRELAQIEAEIGSETADPATAAEPQTEVRAKRGAARTALPDPVEEEEAVSRLLAETESKMGEPESSRRREEFVQMRAAVAAREADGGNTGPVEDPETEYRRDLETAVRPRRPDAAPTNRSIRPNTGRIPPLKLVAEQRIDSPARAASAESPVRPRRVPNPMHVVAEDDPSDGRTTFREFAETVGARDLPDMLEAAAAYLSIIEGLDEFSRPQVMNKIRAIQEEEFSREDGLRSFGQLLREGKIERTRSGRFTASESIGYLPEARAAG